MKRCRMDEKLTLSPDDLVEGITPADIEAALIEGAGKVMGDPDLEPANWAHDGTRWWYWTGDA